MKKSFEFSSPGLLLKEYAEIKELLVKLELSTSLNHKELMVKHDRLERDLNEMKLSNDALKKKLVSYET
jgi:hypothetical protein